ncbi:Cyclochlorotine biosynthesis protein R [Pseudocercospora fuligena]|uniref:Cyclochlorotine biosynthesis protein R n=1 Tax=Pseudocercospora fuligena TaxID=685502 RepID=A0A8H6RRL5_9PEZI|nr:Cyclochlorotine biosynthesis protein R [Pseudocercospora fuligena]
MALYKDTVEGAYTAVDAEEGCNVERKSSDWRRTQLIIEMIIVLLLFVLVGLIIFKPAQKQLHYGNDPRVSSGAFDQFRQYGRDPEYFSFSHEQDYLWAEYLSAKPPPNSTGEAIDRLTNHGSVSMLHQLHCLAGIRRAIQQLGAGDIDLAALQKTEHAPHCFDYLRKVILCYADDFIERPRHKDGTLGGPSIEGAYDFRMCRSSERIFAAKTLQGS